MMDITARTRIVMHLEKRIERLQQQHGSADPVVRTLVELHTAFTEPDVTEEEVLARLAHE